MWVVLKYKLNEINILKENLNRILGKNPIYFVPKIEYQKNIGNKFKTFQKALLEGYLICFDEKFKDQNIINNLKFCRGIKSLLDGFKNNQKLINTSKSDLLKVIFLMVSLVSRVTHMCNNL